MYRPLFFHRNLAGVGIEVKCLCFKKTAGEKFFGRFRAWPKIAGLWAMVLAKRGCVCGTVLRSQGITD